MRARRGDADSVGLLCIVLNLQTEVRFGVQRSDQVGATRDYWTSLKSSGLETRYWAQDNGKWVQKA